MTFPQDMQPFRNMHAVLTERAPSVVEAIRGGLEDEVAVVTGGLPARMACGLPVGDDVDVALSLVVHSKLQKRLLASGFTLSKGAASTGHRGKDPIVMFREKYDPPKGSNLLAVDCLILCEPNKVEAFIRSFDNHVARHMVFYTQNYLGWWLSKGAQIAVEAREPGWIDGAVRTEERLARWNALLPGAPASYPAPETHKGNGYVVRLEGL